MLEISTDEIKRHELNMEKSLSPNYGNYDVSNRQGTDKGPDGGGDGFFFAIGEGESQDDEDKEQLDGDFYVIGQRPFHGVGVVQGVAEAD